MEWQAHGHEPDPPGSPETDPLPGCVVLGGRMTVTGWGRSPDWQCSLLCGPERGLASPRRSCRIGRSICFLEPCWAFMGGPCRPPPSRRGTLSRALSC